MQGVGKIERGKIILSNDPELFGQLMTQRIGANSRGQMVLESKDQLRARGGQPGSGRSGFGMSLTARGKKLLSA